MGLACCVGGCDPGWVIAAGGIAGDVVVYNEWSNDVLRTKRGRKSQSGSRLMGASAKSSGLAPGTLASNRGGAPYATASRDDVSGGWNEANGAKLSNMLRSIPNDGALSAESKSSEGGKSLLGRAVLVMGRSQHGKSESTDVAVVAVSGGSGGAVRRCLSDTPESFTCIASLTTARRNSALIRS